MSKKNTLSPRGSDDEWLKKLHDGHFREQELALHDEVMKLLEDEKIDKPKEKKPNG